LAAPKISVDSFNSGKSLTTTNDEDFALGVGLATGDKVD
jgi:hypothetical protein